MSTSRPFWGRGGRDWKDQKGEKAKAPCFGVDFDRESPPG